MTYCRHAYSLHSYGFIVCGHPLPCPHHEIDNETLRQVLNS